ncbi:hypothetical protein KKF64_02230, partial [Patescibacteria group bacterium]|nr:hypothetical protein [Patescibacteria group bacterium]
MRLIKKNFVIAISVIFLVLLALPVQADFNPPLQAPPSGNVSAPIYSEGASQTLSGGLSVTSGGLSSTNTSAVAVQGSSQAYAIQGTLSSDSASGDSALYANAFAADANDYAAVIYGGLGMQMASGDIFYLNRDSGIAWPRVSDGASLYGISVTATGELRVIGHGAGINFMNQTPASLMTIS